MLERALLKVAVLLAAAFTVSAAGADDKADYERRAAARFAALFQALDLNGDGVVTRGEAQGDLNFLPRFDEMDINRDGTVTGEELRRFIESRFGVNAVASEGQVSPK